MAEYTVAAEMRGAYNKTLVAATADTVTFANDLRTVEVVSNGTADIFVTVDGSTPTVAGANTYILPAGAISVREMPSALGGVTVVKLISSGTPTYSVAGLG